MMAGQICAQKLEEISSKGRLDGYKNASEHRENFLLIGKIGGKIGVLEVAIRNRIAKALGIKRTINLYRPKRLATGSATSKRTKSIIKF